MLKMYKIDMMAVMMVHHIRIRFKKNRLVGLDNNCFMITLIKMWKIYQTFRGEVKEFQKIILLNLSLEGLFHLTFNQYKK